MATVMPKTCWAVSVRQSNKILRLIVASSWVFYLSDWRCTEPQTLKSFVCSLLLILHMSSSINVLNSAASPSPPQMSHNVSAWTYATTFSSPTITLSLLYDAMLVNSWASSTIIMNVTLWVDARKYKCMYSTNAVEGISVENNGVCQLAIPSKVVAHFEWLPCTDVNWNVYVMHIYKTGVLSDPYDMVGKKIVVISWLLTSEMWWVPHPTAVLGPCLAEVPSTYHPRCQNTVVCIGTRYRLDSLRFQTWQR